MENIVYPEYQLKLDDQTMERIAVAYLKHAMYGIEQDADPAYVEIWDSICEVLGYISNPTELREFENRYVPISWMKAVIQYDKERGILETD